MIVFVVSGGKEPTVVEELVVVFGAAAGACSVAFVGAGAWVAEEDTFEVPLVIEY